jgi:uncharacterized membrane protein YkvA (DUF1232 family)
MTTEENNQPSPKLNPQRVRSSATYRGAMAKATKILKKPEKIAKLVSDASAKASKLDDNRLGAAKDNLLALFRLVKAYGKGQYKAISWSNLVLVVAALVYFVTPIDLVPDFLLALGYFDDAALLGWTIRAIGDELAKFTQWEKNQATPVGAVEVADD